MTASSSPQREAALRPSAASRELVVAPQRKTRHPSADLFRALQQRAPKGSLHLLGGALSVAMLALAVYILAQACSTVSLAAVRAAMAATSAAQVGSALTLTLCSYLALMGYDFIALRQIGAKAPPRTVALASFASAAVSFTLGAPLVTGVAVRLWVYARAKLTTVQVANVALASGLAFWLGMTGVLAAGLLLRAAPLAAIDALPPLANGALGALLLAALAAYALWTAQRPRLLRLRGYVIALPGAGATLAQIALGVVDLTCAAGALYVLLPQGHGLDFIGFAALYAVACCLGVISHAPGGVGVFEATMLHGLGGVAPESALAALLLFRAIYYALPFALALALLGAAEGPKRWGALREAFSRAGA